MNTFTIIVLSVSGLLLLYGLYQLIRYKKRFWIPIIIFLFIGFLMIVLGQTVTVTGGSFADVMYTVLGVFSLIIALIIGLITLVIQSRKTAESD